MEFKANKLDGYQLLHQGALALARASRHGIRIDEKYCVKTLAKIDRQIRDAEITFKQTKFYKHWQHVFGSKTNIHSHPQLSQLLYKIRKFEPLKITKTGAGATDSEALLLLNEPELDPIVHLRKLKMQKDHLAGISRETINGIMHPSFLLHTARTYRGSAQAPSFQNIPIRDEESMNICRGAIFPTFGFQLLEIDFSGIEVRTGVCYHKDPNMINYIMDPTTDMHRDQAQQIFKILDFNKKYSEHYYLRQAAKNGFVFPEFYGDYYVACAKNLACRWGKLPQSKWKSGQGVEFPNVGGHLSDWLISQGIKSYAQFEQHLKEVEEDFWYRRFRVYQRWKDQWWAEYQQKGYFDLYTGFRCSGLMGKNDAVNYPVQGSAFHCLLWCFIQIDRIAREERWKSRLIGQIHDSMIIDTHPKELKHVAETVHYVTTKALLKHWKWIIVPMDTGMELCDVDKPWSTKKEYKLVA